MRVRLLLVAALLLTATPAFGQKVFIDYDKAYDTSTIKTFKWQETKDTSLEEDNPLLHSRIVQGVEHYLSMAGLTEVDEDPDVYVTYHGSVKTDVSISTLTFGYAYPLSWGMGGYYGFYGVPAIGLGVAGAPSTAVYKKGTLIVDVWDAHTKELVWRGIAAELKMTEVAETMAKRVDKALAQMVKEWRKAKKKEAREPARAKE